MIRQLRTLGYRIEYIILDALSQCESGDFRRCELNDVNPFDYLITLQQHAEELAKNPAGWMPWICLETLAPSGAGGDFR